MTGLRILADDLSGALDAAVCFADGLQSLLVSRSTPLFRATACSSAARDLGQGPAAKAFSERLPWLIAAGRPFLKVDSRLRGHVAAELAALHASVPNRPIVIAPALPGQGRAMRSGRIWSRQSDGGGWDCEPAALASELGALGLACRLCLPGAPVPPGLSLWDTETEADLDQIATAGALAGAVLCGSSGLAAALSRHLGMPPPVACNSRTGPLLLVVGTAHPLTLRQVAALEAAQPGIRYEIGPDGAGLPQLAKSVAAGEDALATVALPPGCPQEEIQSRITAALSRLVDRLPRPGSLFVTGGETLDTLARALGAEGFVVQGQIAPGVPASRLKGGRWDGLDVVSKSGGFGAFDLLVDMISGRI